MTNEQTSPGIRMYFFDWLVISYCLLNLFLIVLCGHPMTAYTAELLFYASMAAIAALIVRYVDETKSRFHAFIRLLYPAIMFTFFYKITGGVIHLFFEEFFDWQVATFEKMIFGVNPTIFIDQHLLNIWLNEIFSLCYFSYYLMLPVFIISVFFKRDDRIIGQFLAATCLTFFVSYLLFSIYPVEGPRWYFAAQYVNSIDGPFFRQIVNYVIDNAAVHGGAMPSSHTGIAIVVMMFCFRYYRRFGWLLLPIVTGLSIGTVWGRFHYVSDVIPGAAIGIFSTLLIWRYTHLDTTSKRDSRLTKKLRGQHVS